MGKTASQFFLCIFAAALLNFYILLPNGNSIFVGSKTNLTNIAVQNSQAVIKKSKSCKKLDTRNNDSAMALAIVASESSFVGVFETTLEHFLYENLKGALLWMDLSIGPAQLKQNKFLKYPNLNPLNLCDALIIVHQDIKSFKSKDRNFNWVKYLLNYNGASPHNIHGIIYIDYVTSVFSNIRDEL